MNPLDRRDTAQRLHRSEPDPSIEISHRTEHGWASYCQYSRYTVDEPQSSRGQTVAPKTLSPPSHNFYCKGSEVEDADGDPLEMDEEDPELVRKRRELQKIEQQILWKKVSIALKTIDPPVMENTPPEQSAQPNRRDATLKERVNSILLQRHPASFLPKVRPPKETLRSSNLSRHSLLQEDCPLKLRVKALMKQRCSGPCVLPTNWKVPDVTPPRSCRSHMPPAKDENSINEGFQRFLSVLNKGVDIDLLSRIVNDDGEDLPLGEELMNVGTAAMENESDPHVRSQRSNSGASLPRHDETNGGEMKVDPPSRDRSLSEKLLLPNDEENDRGHHSYSSSSRSKSPPAVRKKKKKNEEEPIVHEQHEQLQNILNTLGLSLEAEEMSQLADRTQKRLYGRKHEGARADSRGEQDSRQGDGHRHYRNSSSSSSTSSRSTSRSFSPSPSRRKRPHSGDSKRRRSSERSRSRDGSRDGPTRRESEEAQRLRDRTDSEEAFAYQHLYPQNQTHPHPAAFSQFPSYSLSHYPQYSNHHWGAYSAASDYWTYTQSVTPPPYYPSGHPYPQNIYSHICGSSAPPPTKVSKVYPRRRQRRRRCVDKDLLKNPDLSKSEGQRGSRSGHRNLQVISTKLSDAQDCAGHMMKSLETVPLVNHCSVRQNGDEEEKHLQAVEKQMTDSVKTVEAPQTDKDDSSYEQSEKEKQQPTEEEIKANLRKKLEAFNQKVKQKVTQPASQLNELSD